MKKVITAIVILASTAMIFSACHPTQDCPAYGKVDKPSTEKVNG